MKKEIKIAIIEWGDSLIHNRENQTSLDEILKEAKPFHVYSAGIIICEDKKSITLARDWFDEYNDYRGAATIPKFAIKKIKYFKL